MIARGGACIVTPMGDSSRSNGKGQNGAPKPAAARSERARGEPELERSARSAPSKEPSRAAEGHARSVRAFETVRQFLESDGWYPQRVGDDFVYRVRYAAKHGSLRCYAQVRVDLEQLMFYVVAPVKVPVAARGPVAEFVTRANYGMRIGNFELDMSDGEVRYKSALDFEGVELAARLVQNLVYPAVSTMDRYLPGLLSVVKGQASAAEAIAAVEAEE